MPLGVRVSGTLGGGLWGRVERREELVMMTHDTMFLNLIRTCGREISGAVARCARGPSTPLSAYRCSALQRFRLLSLLSLDHRFDESGIYDRRMPTFTLILLSPTSLDSEPFGRLPQPT